MMSVIALSLPEMVILRKVLKWRLIATFVGGRRHRHPARRLPVQRGSLIAALHRKKGLTMKDIKVLGTGCANCKNTVRLIEEVARAKGVEIQLEKVEDIQKIMTYNILATPGVGARRPGRACRRGARARQGRELALKGSGGC